MSRYLKPRCLIIFAGGVVDGDYAMPNVAADAYSQPPAEKRKRCPDEVFPIHGTHVGSSDGVQIVGQPSEPHASESRPFFSPFLL